jgi:hypothetical protein
VDARALDERRRQRARLRLSGDRVGRGLHVVGEQPREPADAVVERRRERPAGRGRLPARRGDGRGLDADAAARPRGRALRRAARAGLHGLRAHEPRRRAGVAALRPRGRARQNLAPAPAQHDRPPPPPLADELQRVDARRPARRVRALRHHRD